MTKLASIALALNLFACASDPAPDPIGTCGDNHCDSDETATSCPADCKMMPSTCGNKVCDSGETTATCPGDCPAADVCGDNKCGTTETVTGCAADCAAKFNITNNSTRTIGEVYVWACGATNTYVNILNGTLPPGYYVETDTMPPGCWNFQAYATNGVSVYDNNVQLQERVLTTWSLN
jgi:hypothetical protein